MSTVDYTRYTRIIHCRPCYNVYILLPAGTAWYRIHRITNNKLKHARTYRLHWAPIKCRSIVCDRVDCWYTSDQATALVVNRDANKIPIAYSPATEPWQAVSRAETGSREGCRSVRYKGLTVLITSLPIHFVGFVFIMCSAHFIFDILLHVKSMLWL